jgi:hypothetical protein
VFVAIVVDAHAAGVVGSIVTPEAEDVGDQVTDARQEAV